MDKKELLDYQFELLKKNHSVITEIENPTKEMKDFLIEEKSGFMETLTDLTEEQMNKIVQLGYYRVSFCNIDWSKITEESVLMGLTMTRGEFSQFIHAIIENFSMTHNVAKTLANKNLLWAKNENVEPFLNEQDVESAVEEFLKAHLLKDDNHSYSLNIVFPESIPITDKQWQCILDNDIFEDEFLERTDVPQDYKNKHLDKWNGYLDSKYLKNITWKDAIYWIENYLIKRERDIKELFEYLSKEDKIEVLKRKPECIKYIRTPKAYECDAAIEGNPMSIQYIENPTQAVIKKALSLNKDVESVLDKNNENVCKVLGIEKFIPTKKYPATKYLVTFDEDLCDEGNLVRVMVVDGKDMDKFMNSKFTVSFGNLDDDKERIVKNCATYKPIHNDELKVLKKFGLNNIESGYFGFDFDDEDDD